MIELQTEMALAWKHRHTEWTKVWNAMVDAPGLFDEARVREEIINAEKHFYIWA